MLLSLQTADMALRNPRTISELLLSQSSCLASRFYPLADKTQPAIQLIGGLTRKNHRANLCWSLLQYLAHCKRCCLFFFLSLNKKKRFAQFIEITAVLFLKSLNTIQKHCNCNRKRIIQKVRTIFVLC